MPDIVDSHRQHIVITDRPFDPFAGQVCCDDQQLAPSQAIALGSVLGSFL